MLDFADTTKNTKKHPNLNTNHKTETNILEMYINEKIGVKKFQNTNFPNTPDSPQIENNFLSNYLTLPKSNLDIKDKHTLNFIHYLIDQNYVNITHKILNQSVICIDRNELSSVGVSSLDLNNGQDPLIEIKSILASIIITEDMTESQITEKLILASKNLNQSNMYILEQSKLIKLTDFYQTDLMRILVELNQQNNYKLAVKVKFLLDAMEILEKSSYSNAKMALCEIGRYAMFDIINSSDYQNLSVAVRNYYNSRLTSQLNQFPNLDHDLGDLETPPNLLNGNADEQGSSSNNVYVPDLINNLFYNITNSLHNKMFKSYLKLNKFKGQSGYDSDFGSVSCLGQFLFFFDGGTPGVFFHSHCLRYVISLTFRFKHS